MKLVHVWIGAALFTVACGDDEAPASGTEPPGTDDGSTAAEASATLTNATTDDSGTTAPAEESGTTAPAEESGTTSPGTDDGSTGADSGQTESSTGADESSTTAADCDPSLPCGDAETCVGGLLYPSTCGPTNCDEPIGVC